MTSTVLLAIRAAVGMPIGHLWKVSNIERVRMKQGMLKKKKLNIIEGKLSILPTR